MRISSSHIGSPVNEPFRTCTVYIHNGDGKLSKAVLPSSGSEQSTVSISCCSGSISLAGKVMLSSTYPATDCRRLSRMEASSLNEGLSAGSARQHFLMTAYLNRRKETACYIEYKVQCTIKFLLLCLRCCHRLDLHFCWTGRIGWFLKPLSTLQHLQKCCWINCRVRSPASHKHLPACHTKGPLHMKYSTTD